MTTARDDRPVRRSTGKQWLDRKYAQQPANPKLAAWADQTIETLLTAPGTARQIPLRTTDPERARSYKNALYAARDRYNRRHPDAEHISLSANLADLDTGQCRNCAKMACPPSEHGVHTIHLAVFTKRQGRAHQASVPRDQWSYDGSLGRPRRTPEAMPAPPAGTAPEPSRPGERFGRGKRRQAEAELKDKQADSSEADDDAQEETAGQDNGILGKLRSWAG